MLKDPKKTIVQLANQVGKHEAQRLLVDEGVSTSTAQKLVANRYSSEVGELIMRAIRRAAETAKKRQAS